MSKRMLFRRGSMGLVVLVAVAALPAAAAGTVEVSWVQPEAFRDIGRKTWEREDTLKSLAAHFKQHGSRLPDGQTLKIEVLEVDLAGELEPGTLSDQRVLRGAADGPSIRLRYSLQQGGQVLKTGEDQLTDTNYYKSTLRAQVQSDSDLAYEKHMISKWFAETFAPR